MGSPQNIGTKRAFTLIELLVVIAIISILSIVVILLLNPLELFRQTRDSRRLSDIQTLNTAIGIYAEDVGGSMGTPSTTYVSIPDPSATSTTGDQCQGLGLPALPSGITYQCSSPLNFRNVNGTGWIPLNFNNITLKPPMSSLPTDPVNATSSGLYYTYSTNGTQFEIVTILESQKQKAQLGSNPMVTAYPEIGAVGNSLSLSNLFNPNGLMAYWPFDEGSGSSTVDVSGNNRKGSWVGTPAGSKGYYSAGKVGPYAGYFDGTTNYVAASGTPFQFSNTAPFSLVLWVNLTSATGGNFPRLISKESNPLTAQDFNVSLGISSNVDFFDRGMAGNATATVDENSGTGIAPGTWYNIAATYDGQTMSLYNNGTLMANVSSTRSIGNANDLFIGALSPVPFPSSLFNGYVDDVRIYNKSLSPAEVQALYNAEK
jgi:prepilin-type N-terminal cleavage/methylation domain-containing protein